MNNSKNKNSLNSDYSQNDVVIDNNLPPSEGVSHININYHSPSLIGRYLSPYTLTPFSPDNGSTAYACPEAYFVKQRYILVGQQVLPDDLELLHGSAILSAKRAISESWRSNGDGDVVQQDNSQIDCIKEVLRDVLLAKLYVALLTNIELYGEEAIKLLNIPYVCYLTKSTHDGRYIDTAIFKQLTWVSTVVQKAIDEINATIKPSDHYLEVLTRFIENKLEANEKDITFYDPNSFLGGRKTVRDIRSMAKDYFKA